MDADLNTRLVKLEIDNFVFYRRSKIGLIVGKLVEPLVSKNQVFLNTGEDCKIKFQLDCQNINLQQLATVKVVNFQVESSFEEKTLRGAPVKQFTAKSVLKYNADDKREAIPF